MYKVKKDPLMPSGVVATRKLMENSTTFCGPECWEMISGLVSNLENSASSSVLVGVLWYATQKKKRHLTDLVESVSNFASVAPAVVHEVLTSNMLLLSSRPT